MTGKYVYICGSGHSGSTLLNLLLGNQPGLAGFGEIAQTVRRIHGLKKPCTCGQKPCPVWGPVLEQVASLPQDDVDGRIVAAVGAIAGSSDRIVVDSSKTLSTLRLIRDRLPLDIHVIHIVRDGRAVAYSNYRKDRDLTGTAIAWRKANANIETYLSDMPRDRQIHLRYEDLVADPASQLRRVLAFLGLPSGEIGLSWMRETQHHLQGNRMRFGTPAVRRDLAYVEAVGWRDWARLNLTIGRTLWRYGYPLSKSGMRALLSRSIDAGE